METKLVFDLSKFNDEEEKMSKILEFIVNRAAMIGRDVCDGILLPTLSKENENNVRIFMLYQIVRMISLYRDIKVYVGTESKHVQWYDIHNQNFKMIRKRQIKKYMSDTRYVKYCTLTCDEVGEDYGYPHIFYGFSAQDIEDMAAILYGFGG